MTADEEMREGLRKFEAKLDGLQQQVNQLPTKADLSGFATKNDLSRFATKDDLSQFATKDDLSQFATKDDLSRFAAKDDLSRFATKDDLIEFKDEIIKNFKVLSEDAKENVKKAAEGYGATLERIGRDLGDLNRKVDEGLFDHTRILADHNKRLVSLERGRRRS